jgi:hypothetical protein
VPFYEAYGLSLDSELPLPELFPSSSIATDLILRIGPVTFDPPETNRVICRPVSTGEMIVYFKGVGTAWVDGGRKITLQPDGNADELTLRLFVLQQVMSVILLQRGYLVLHASAAVVEGHAVAFAGPSGQGKSTMAGALNREGSPILADDVLALDMNTEPKVLPGLLHLKLTEEARRELAPEILSEQTIRDRTAKKLCAIRGIPARTPARLHSIYLLSHGPTVQFQSVPPAKAAIELVRHTYGADLLPHLGRSISHFKQCVTLANRIPISVLSRPRDLSLLNEISEKIIARVKQSPPL